jgi:hypothetical protein
MTLLLNKYPGESIDKQFNRVLKYLILEKIIHIPIQEKVPIDFCKTMFVHPTYCLNMRTFSTKFHALCNKYSINPPIDEIMPVLGTRNVNNLQRQLVHNT